MTELHPSDSKAQRDAELAMVEAVAAELGVPLKPRRVWLPGGTYCDVDGVSADEMILVEAYAHHGKIVSAHKKKISEDALKLLTLARARPGARCYLALADPVAAASIVGWRRDALETWGVDLLVVELKADAAAAVRSAQEAQRMTNAVPPSV